MKKYSQRNLRWRWKKLGFCNTTIGQNGCVITCLANLTNRTPTQVNEILKAKGGYINGCLVLWKPACRALGLGWHGRSGRAKHYPTIAEVRLSGYKHFVVMVDENRIIDPWNLKPRIKKNPYKVYGYRNVKVKVKKKKKSSQKPVIRKPKISYRYYRARRGDTLWKIAKRYLGSGLKWTRLRVYRKGAYRRINPITLKVGEKVRIPK